MGNHTVNKEEIIERAAGIGDRTKTAAVAWQNNRPQKLEIEVTNSKEPKNLPFMIENGDLISSTDVEVVIKNEDNTPKQNQERMAKRNGGKIRSKDDEPTH